jgi:hypothetical protein
MFYPGSGSDHCSIPDPDPGSWIQGLKKHRIPDPTYFCIKAINKFCLLIPDPDPTIAPSRIRWVKKHRIRIRNTRDNGLMYLSLWLWKSFLLYRIPVYYRKLWKSNHICFVNLNLQTSVSWGHVASNKTEAVVNLIVRIVGYYTLQFCDNYMGMDQSEEEKYFLLLRYWLKSKGTFPLSL